MLDERIYKFQLKDKMKKLADNETMTVMFLPSKANPYSNWFKGVGVAVTNKGVVVGDEIVDLDKYINEFAYYNCNSELGNRVAYYI